jgi:hypothetical protein
MGSASPYRVQGERRFDAELPAPAPIRRVSPAESDVEGVALAAENSSPDCAARPLDRFEVLMIVGSASAGGVAALVSVLLGLWLSR